MFLPRRVLKERLMRMLAEDLGQGDVTTSLVVPAEAVAEASVICRENGVAAGVEEARVLLEGLGLNVEQAVNDGEHVKPKQVLLRVAGDAQTIISAERTVLNILTRMSGIATTARRLKEKLEKAGLKTIVACTRKTAPGLLYFDKKAAALGGADTHRLHLDDMILIKDSHIVVAGSVEKAVANARRGTFSKKIEVEVATVADAVNAAKAGADIVMLDNFSPEQIRESVKMLKKKGLREKILLEVSGGVTADNILDLASRDVDIISVGAITHSPKSLDISLEIVKARGKAK